MNYRQLAIRVLYLSLAFAALTGITAVFVPVNSTILFRLLASAIATGFSAAFMLLAIRLLENPRLRPIGSTIGVLICIVYSMFLFTIWLDAVISIPAFLTEHLAFTTWIIFLCGIPITTGSACCTRTTAKKAGIFIIFVWISLACIWITATWINSEEFSQFLGHVALPLAWCSVAAALLLLNWPKYATGFVITILTCVLWQWFAMKSNNDWSMHTTALRWILVFGWISCTYSLRSLLTLRKPAYAVKRIEMTAICLGSLAFGTCFILLWAEMAKVQHDLLVRLSIATAILGGTAVLGTFITQVLRMSMIIKSDSPPLRATCPRCMHEIDINQGKSSCPICGLRFKLLFEFPCCRKCEYDVTQTTEDRCPECGEPIGASSTS